MATITSLGVGSNMDLEGLLQGLMQVEKRPLLALQDQAKSYNAKISAFGTLNSKLASLQTVAKNMTPATLQSPMDKFASYKASFADENIGSATASTGASPGSYGLEVNQLAQGQRLNYQSGAPIGTGTLSIKLGSVVDGSFVEDPDRTVNIDITSENNSLEGLRNAINNSGSGINATIVNGKDGPQLMLSGADGGDQAFALEGISGFEYNPATGGAGFTQNQAAQNAEFSVNGIAVSSNSNKVTDAIDGVTLNLTKTGSTTLKIEVDTATKLKSSLEEFVKAYNEANSTMKSLGAYDPATKTAGALQGNNVLRTTEANLRNLVFGTEEGGMRLADVGISFSTDGSLKLDTEKLDAVLAAKPEAVANLAATVGKAFNDTIEQAVGISGSIKSSTDSIQTMVRDLDKRQDAIQLRLDQVEARYRKQFTALDGLLANMNKTSSFLAQQLASLPK